MALPVVLNNNNNDPKTTLTRAVQWKQYAIKVTFADVTQRAKRQLSKENAAIVSADLAMELKTLAKHLFGVAARDTLMHSPAAWTELQADRVRLSLRVFDLTELADLETTDLRCAMFQMDTQQERSLTSDFHDITLKTAGASAPSNSKQNPLFSFSVVESIAEETWFGMRGGLTLSEIDTHATWRKKPLRCALTWKLLSEGDPVRRFRTVFNVEATSLPEKNGINPSLQQQQQQKQQSDKAPTTVPELRSAAERQGRGFFEPRAEQSSRDASKAPTAEKNTPATSYIYQGYMDDSLISDRHPHLQQTQTNLCVSDLGVRISAFSRASQWVKSRYLHSMAQSSKCSAAGNTSHQVLQQQRTKRKHGSGGTKRPAVLKKNKPVQIEQLFLDWDQRTNSDVAIEQIVDIFGQFKTLQIAFIVSRRLLGEIHQAGLAAKKRHPSRGIPMYV